MAAVAAPLALPSCPACRGGGEINGLTCRECGGARRAVRRPGRWRSRLAGWPTAAGVVAGKAMNWSRSVPGIGGAAAVTFGVSAVTHAAWHWVPALGVAALVGGVFALALDRRL